MEYVELRPHPLGKRLTGKFGLDLMVCRESGGEKEITVSSPPALSTAGPRHWSTAPDGQRAGECPRSIERRFKQDGKA